jgi:TadE-like protein
MSRRIPWHRGVRPRDDRGSTTLELVILGPALLTLLGLVIVAGRVAAASAVVEQAAAAGARAASLARDAGAASAAAERTVRASLSQQSISCQPLEHSIDTGGFRIPVGRPAEISVQVSCTVPLGQLGVPGMPGSRVVRAGAVSPLDSFRGRS